MASLDRSEKKPFFVSLSIVACFTGLITVLSVIFLFYEKTFLTTKTRNQERAAQALPQRQRLRGVCAA
jgi:uncharacterized membrane protein